MMIKHLRDFLRAYLKEKTIEGPISLRSSNEHLLFDILLKKFINPKLDLPAKIVPLGIKDEHEFHNLYDFNRTNQVNINTSSIDYFWGKKKGSKGKKHSNYPALPPVHNKPQETGPFREGWAGQLTKPPVSNPRPEKGSSSCFEDPDKDPKKKPKKKKQKNLVCGKNIKQEKDISTTKEANENLKCLELPEKDCKYSKDVKPAESTSQPQYDDKWSSKLDKERSKKESRNVFKNICSKLFLSGKYEEKTRKKESSGMSHKSSSQLENDSCKLKADLENELIKKVKDCNKTTENISKIEYKKDNLPHTSNSAQGKYNVCDMGKEPKKPGKSELVTPKSKCFPDLNTKPCPCTLTSSVTKTKPDPCGFISAKPVVENTVKYKQETPCSESICRKPCTDDKILKPSSKSTSISAQHDTTSDTNMTAGKGSICPEVNKRCVTANIDEMKKECKRSIAQEFKTSSFQKALQCTALMVNKKDICDNKSTATKNIKYNFIVDPKVQKLKPPCPKNDDVSTKEIRNKECKISKEPSKEHKVISDVLNVCDCKEKTCDKEESSKINDSFEACDKNICKNDKQSVKCPLSLSESTNVQCPKSKKDENVTQSANICTKLTRKDAELVLAECPKPKTKECVSKKDDRIRQTSKGPQETKERNAKRQCKSLSAFQCQHIEPKVTEKLQIISQETSFNQVGMNSDLSKLKFEKYMGFKIKRSSAETIQPDENKMKTSKSPCKKLSSIEKPCATSIRESEVKIKEPKKYKNNENYSKHKKIDTKITKSELCLKNSKTSLKKGKSSTDKKLNSKKSISCPNKMREEKRNEVCGQSKTSELSPKRFEAKICSPSSEVNSKTNTKKVSSKQNIKKSKLVEDCCLSDISNIVESNKECTIKDLKKFSDHCEQDNSVEKIDKDLSNQCNKNVDDGESLNKKEAICEEQVDKLIKTNGSKCSEMNKPEESKIKCPTNKQPKSSSEQSQESMKRKISNKVKRNKSAVICSFDKASNKSISLKSKATQNSKKILLKAKSSPNITKTSSKGKKSKFCNKVKDPKTQKSKTSMRNTTVCSKPSRDLEITTKEKSSSSKTKLSKSKNREKSKDSKDNISKSSNRSKSTRMCSLQTLQKRVTENAVKKSKTVEVKSFSEMKSNGPEIDKADLQNGSSVLGNLSEIKEKKVQDRSNENIVVLFDKEKKLDNSNVLNPKSGTTAVQYSQKNEYWYTNNMGSKFALKEGESQNEYSKLECSKLMHSQRHLTIPEHIIQQNKNNKDSSTVKTIRSNLPKMTQKTRKIECASVQNNNTTAKFTKKDEVNTMIKIDREELDRIDEGKNIQSVESKKMGENFKCNDSVMKKYDIKDKHDNKKIILTNKSKSKDSIVRPIFVKKQNVIDQPVCENLQSAMHSEIKSKENEKHWIGKNLTVGKKGVMQKNKFSQEQIILSNNIKKTIKTDLVDKSLHKHQNNNKKDELNIKELLNQQKLTKLKIFNPTISKRFALRSINGSHVLPIAIKTERNRGKSSYSSTEGNKHNSDAFKKTITETINKPSTDKSHLNTNNKLNKRIKIGTDLNRDKKIQPFNGTNKLQPYLPSKSPKEHMNGSLCSDNKNYGRKNIISDSKAQHQDKSITLKTSNISINNEQYPKDKQTYKKEKHNHVSEQMGSTKLSVVQNNENDHINKKSLNKSTVGNLKSDNCSSKLNMLNILISNGNQPKDKVINTTDKTEKMLMKLSSPEHKKAQTSSVKQSLTGNEIGHLKSDNYSSKLNMSDIVISNDKWSSDKESNTKEMKRDFKAEKIHMEPSAQQLKEAVYNSTKQSVTKNVTGNFKSDNLLKLHKPVSNKITPSLENRIKNSPSTCVNLNKDSLTNTKEDVSSEVSKTNTNNLQDTLNNVKREKIYTIQNIKTKTALQSQNKRTNLINANLKNPPKLENFNRNKNVNIKSKTFIQETSSSLVNRNRPNTVNNTFAHTQNLSLVKSLAAKNNVEKQQIRLEVKNVQDKMQKNTADTTKKLTNPRVKSSLSPIQNDTIERQRTFMTKPGKRLKKIMKKNTSLKVKRCKTYVVLRKSNITNSLRENRSLVGSVQSKTQETGNMKQINTSKENDVKKSIKVDRIRKRASVIFKDHKSNSNLSQRNVTNNINNGLDQGKTNENKIKIPLSKELSKVSLLKSNSDQNLKSLLNSNINESGKNLNTSHTNINRGQMNKNKTVNVFPSSKLNSTHHSPFKKIPGAK
ncbi:protein PF14_0175-like isoform X2 [Homalodisca vitripennis]|uniref:protein PF14_0175-like isoform X2 n=1 Tax=Homalodisca vitripennis TaxID=197043 RepID=UPI001EEB0188|nr:protein PF14_0175-like isoform X2 [Homalodisca vitripennis]